MMRMMVWMVSTWCIGGVKPRERVPKPTTPMRLTDISSVQHDDDDDDDDDGMDGKYIMHRWCETQGESAQAYYTNEVD